VVTDVGDSALLVGETGRVVPAGDDAALAGACAELLAQPSAVRQALGAQCRRRIARQFSFDQMVERHLQLWGELAGRPIAKRPSGEPGVVSRAA